MPTTHEEVHRTADGLATVTVHDATGRVIGEGHGFTLSDARRAAHHQIQSDPKEDAMNTPTTHLPTHPDSTVTMLGGWTVELRPLAEHGIPEVILTSGPPEDPERYTLTVMEELTPGETERDTVVSLHVTEWSGGPNPRPFGVVVVLPVTGPCWVIDGRTGLLMDDEHVTEAYVHAVAALLGDG